MGWALGQDGIYLSTAEWICWERKQKYAIRYRDFESGQVTRLLDKEDSSIHFGLAVSPDEEWVLYGEAPVPTTELMLVENFR